MVGISQYPDVLTYVKSTGGGSHYDGDGNLIIDEPTEETIRLKCRAEANSSGKYIIGEDGQQIVFAWRIFFPLPVNEIPVGTSIEVLRKGVLRAKGDIKRFVIDQLNAKAEV